jgi:hypothetical protein
MQKELKENKRSRRQIKKAKKDSSMSSEDFSDSMPFEESVNKEVFEEETSEHADIVMEGNLLYRYDLDQVEFEGSWSMSNDFTKEKFSYLLLKEKQNLVCPIKLNDVDCNDLYDVYGDYLKKYINKPRDEYLLHICSSNLFEAILIPHSNVFNSILNFLTGEYHGFFLYYNKTIEDRFYLNFSLEDNQVRINGKN